MTAVMLDSPIDLDIAISTPDALVEGDWMVPPHPKAAVILANGTGANRRSERTRAIARHLYNAGFATFLVDILSESEEREDLLTGAFQLDVQLQATRLIAAARWIENSGVGDLPIGIMASGVASAAAIVASVREPRLVSAIVSRGGRPDLAAIDLHRLMTPTLLITGSRDTRIFELNRWALRRMKGDGRIAIVPGASHLFEEPGTLEEMSLLAVRWFDLHLHPVQFSLSRGRFDFGWSASAGPPNR
jgi:putative phosphoribosyl transferase